MQTKKYLSLLGIATMFGAMDGIYRHRKDYTTKSFTPPPPPPPHKNTTEFVFRDEHNNILFRCFSLNLKNAERKYKKSLQEKNNFLTKTQKQNNE